MGVYSWGNHVTCGACSMAICLVTRRFFIREFGVQTPSRLYVRSTRDLSSCNLFTNIFTYCHQIHWLHAHLNQAYQAIWIAQPRGSIYIYKYTWSSYLHCIYIHYIYIYTICIYVYTICIYIYICVCVRVCVCKMINNYRSTEDVLIPTSSHTNDDDDDDDV